jgi:hypothetical protein
MTKAIPPLATTLFSRACVSSYHESYKRIGYSNPLRLYVISETLVH